MEDLPNNEYEAKIYLHDKDSLNSKVLKKSYCVTFIYEDKNNFKIKAYDEEETYFYHFKMTHWANRKEKDFIYQINNFKILLETIQIAVEKNRVTLIKDYDNLKLTLHYTNIFTEKKISFDLHPQLTNEEEKKLIGKYYEESEALLETKGNPDYRAEILEYNKNFEDYGDRNIIRLTLRNTGNCVWERGIASLQCVPEFSSLLCEEYFFDDDIIAGDDVKIELEFLKYGKEHLDPPYFTCLHLHIHPQNFAPMLVLDFNNAFNTEQKMPQKKKPNFNEIYRRKINVINEKIDIKNKINVINEKDDNKNKINAINFEEDNKNKINAINFEEDNKNKIIDKENKKNNIPQKKPENEIIKNDDFDEEEEEKLKKMNPIQRKIYLLNKKENNRIKKEQENKEKGFKKNLY